MTDTLKPGPMLVAIWKLSKDDFHKWLKDQEDLRTWPWSLRANALTLWLSHALELPGYASSTQWFGRGCAYGIPLPPWMRVILSTYDAWALSLYSRIEDRRRAPYASCGEVLKWTTTHKKEAPEWKPTVDRNRIRGNQQRIKRRNRRLRGR